MKAPRIEPDADVAILSFELLLQEAHRRALSAAPRPVDADGDRRVLVLAIDETRARMHERAEPRSLACGGLRMPVERKSARETEANRRFLFCGNGGEPRAIVLRD